MRRRGAPSSGEKAIRKVVREGGGGSERRGREGGREVGIEGGREGGRA